MHPILDEVWFIHQMKSLIPKQILHNIFFWGENIIIFPKLNVRKFSCFYQKKNQTNKQTNKLEEAKTTM